MNFDYGCWPYLELSILDKPIQETNYPKRSDDDSSSESSDFELKITQEEKEFLCSVCNRLLKMSNRMQATAYGDTELSPEKLEALIKKIYEAKGE